MLRYLLFPIAWLYGFVVWCRNQLYDRGIWESVGFKTPIISIGNLSTGGTGKTPHVEFLVQLLSPKHQVATLSRGYKRQTSGYQLATTKSTALTIGDEPLQIKTKFPDIAVAVGEKRATAIPPLLSDVPETTVIILDDAFQHRPVQPHLSILLTTYQKRFTHDYLLPVGNLREPKSGYQRATIIIVTKCPSTLSIKERQTIVQEIKPLAHQKVFFSYLKYSPPYALFHSAQPIHFPKQISVLLVCAIARTNAITNYLKTQVEIVETCFFGDHHYFSQTDIHRIAKQFAAMPAASKIIVTTEKDATRLQLHKKQLVEMNLPIYCLPIQVYFSARDQKILSNEITVI